MKIPLSIFFLLLNSLNGGWWQEKPYHAFMTQGVDSLVYTYRMMLNVTATTEICLQSTKSEY